MNTQVASPLSRKAVLVSLSISQWSGRKLDRVITDETNARYNARQDAGRYNKLLLDGAHLATIGNAAGAARTLFYQYTKPWLDEGTRILPNVLYMEFANKFREVKREFETAADDFCRDYSDFVEERRIALNGMFRE